MKKILLSLFITCAFSNMFAQPGSALNFDGSNDNIRRGVVSTATAGVTFEARVNWGGVAPSARYILYNGTNGTNGFGLYLASGSTSITIKNGTGVYTSSVTLQTNSMTMISVVALGPNGLQLFVNGVLAQSFFPPPVPAISGSFAIGSDDAGANNFNGIIDEVRYWNRALCAAEIAHRANCQAVGNEPNLVALYHFNQGIDAANNPTISTLIDSSPSSFTATLNNFALTTGSVSNWIAAAGSLTSFCTFAPNTVTVSPAGPVILCAGNSASLTATGAFTYTWNPGALTGSMAVITPTATGIYSVVGNSGNCYGIGGKSVTVNALPTVSVATTSTLLCAGQSATLTGSGATSYTWNPGGTGSVIVVSPSVNATYTISVVDANTCTNTAQFTQSVQVCSGLSQYDILDSQYSIYPNPNNGEFSINLTPTAIGTVSENTSIEIYNSIGQLILTEKINAVSTKINFTQMPKGIYVLRFKENNTVINARKIVKE